jgi:hypothetical protein
VVSLFEVAVSLIHHGYEFLRSKLTELRCLSYCCLVREAEIPVETVQFHSVLTRLSPEKTPDLSPDWSILVLTYSVFHCFTVHFNSLNIMSQQMHIYIIKH